MAVAFINSNTDIKGTTATISGAQTVTASGTNLCAVAAVTIHDNTGGSGTTVTAITYGGQTMSAAGSIFSFTSGGTTYYTQHFTLVNPPTGSNTLSVTISVAQKELRANITAFNGVDQTNPMRPGTSNSVTGAAQTTASVTITSDASDLTVTVVADTAADGWSGSNQTRDVNDTTGTYNFFADHATTGAASVTHTWGNVSDTGLVSGFSVQTVQAAGSVVSPRSLALLGVGS